MLKASEELRLCADAHEQEVITLDGYELKELLKRDPNIEYIVDIGGNIGCFSIMASNLFPKAKIIMCEPEPELMKYAKENLVGKNVNFVQKAIIGDENLKTVTFNVCKWQGNHHVDGRFNWDNYTPAGSKKIGEITVEATTLSQVMFNSLFPRIDLLKIDTEGAEPEILRSAKDILKLVKHIAVEWHSQNDLALIKAALLPTHNIIVSDGAFYQPDGRVANGNIVAELRTKQNEEVEKEIYAPKTQRASEVLNAAFSNCCKVAIKKEGDKMYCSNCHRLAI
jgi:FkbM family methyltransferase